MTTLTQAESALVRERILKEVQRIRASIHGCAHCAALRDQAVRLLSLMPPEPVTTPVGTFVYTGPLPDAIRQYLNEEPREDR
jgi:hypothetical protein